MTESTNQAGMELNEEQWTLPAKRLEAAVQNLPFEAFAIDLDDADRAELREMIVETHYRYRDGSATLGLHPRDGWNNRAVDAPFELEATAHVSARYIDRDDVVQLVETYVFAEDLKYEGVRFEGVDG